MAPETAGAQPSPVHREAGSAGSQGAGRTVDAQGRSVPRGLPAARRVTERHGAFLKGIPNASFKPFVLKKMSHLSAVEHRKWQEPAAETPKCHRVTRRHLR